VVKINGEMLTWAREEAGISLATAAKLLGFKATKNTTAEEKLRLIERDGELSQSTFDKVLSVYRKPMLTYFLDSPPKPTIVGHDFRSPNRSYDPSQNLIVKAILSNVAARQNMVREILLSEEEAVKLPFIGSVSITADPRVVAEEIRKIFCIDLLDFRKGNDYATSFRYIRKKIEEQGVFVLLKGNLGNHFSDVEVGTFRGFAISDDIAPFIVINHQESKSSRAHTLLHELVHILLGQSGVSAEVENDFVEKFCDQVASATLLHEHEIASFRPPIDSFALLAHRISDFALSKKVSSTHVCFKLFEIGYITQDLYSELAKYYHMLWQQQKIKDKDSSNTPNGLVTKKSYLGGKLVDFAERMYFSGAISPTQAGIVLETSPAKITRMFQASALA